MVEIRKGKPGELADIRDFINMVFSMNNVPHNFKELLPKLYKDGAGTEGYHYLAVEEGKIRAAVCSWPIVCTCGEQSLKAAYIGSVSVHPDSRGEGYMKLLMEAAIADMKKDGVDFSALDGYRQRYRHFGYEKCGSVMEYFFTGNSFIHMACEQPKAEITLRRVGSEEREWVEEAYAMFNEQLTHCLRTPEAFSDTVRSWTVTPYVVESNGKMAGYFVEKDGQIGELVLRDEDLVVPVLRTFYEMAGKMSLTLLVYPHETERMDRLLACCETVSVKEEGNYRIFNFESVLRFAMNVAAESKTLADGSLTVEIIGYGTVVVRVENGIPSAERTEAVADCRLTPEEAARFFFSPVLIGEARRLEAAGGVNWLPLPLSINHQDKC